MGTPKKSPLDNLKEPWKKGDPSPNPSGRPKGQRNYATLYRIALERIGKAKNMTGDEVEEIMHQTGLNKAFEGDPVFYKDTLDRLHGKPVQKTQVGGDPDNDTPIKFSSIDQMIAEIDSQMKK